MFDQLTNHGMIDRMYHQYKRFESINQINVDTHYLKIKIDLNYNALWQKWIRK